MTLLSRLPPAFSAAIRRILNFTFTGIFLAGIGGGSSYGQDNPPGGTPPAATNAIPASAILTPPSPDTPRINGPKVFGVRPGSPFLYSIPATGKRPMEFSATGLPTGLQLDGETGHITGILVDAGNYNVTLRAKNALGSAEKQFGIVAGERIALTPPMGWNSWNCWAGAVDQQKVLRSARAVVSSGLINHGWTFVNIDDTWQGRRTGSDHALQGNEKFPDMKALCDEIHRLGLKAGIYSTPWVTSYAGYPGGSSDDPDGEWSLALANGEGHRHGTNSFAAADANQWAAWGFDYLKYDWNPNDVPHTAEMGGALRSSGRDIIYSLSNTAPFKNATNWAQLANCWRTTGDIVDAWEKPPQSLQRGVAQIAFTQDRWAPVAGSGHWNDPDMLVVGYVGWGPQLHLTRLTADEQYTHISMWCLLSAPLLIGCDLERLDAFTYNLLSNDEVLAVDQDSLGRQAVRVSNDGEQDVFAKQLDDGSLAVGLVNRGADTARVTARWADLKITGKQTVRDLWRQKDLGAFENQFEAGVASHGTVLVRVFPAK
jgi:alpha-galactosidase